ncbi:azurin [Tamlana agarivorans]|uniref:Azurin n=1 Tax=Pseudotamlana agarivorans TaxID=481183 RepID=A0ACC5U969_9FLAO|nr:azurin [Tamlana agarivorans]MBU2950794.1 azurin [Tamlana agarivorans]
MKTLKYLVLSIISCLVVVGCGDKKEKKKEGFTYENTTNSTKEVVNSPNDVVLTSNDAMQFNKREIKVRSGSKVKLTFKHLGKMDKNIMGHNFVLLKSGVDLVAFGNKAATARDSGYIPDDGEAVIAHTKLIGGGETTVIEFEAPEKGTYDFLCSFPGHFAIMKGKFIVE